MTFKIIKNTKISKITTCVPSITIDNSDVPQEQKKIRDRLIRNVGIKYRRMCPDNQIFTDLASYCTEELLDCLGWERDSVGSLIMVTQSSEFTIPSTAIILQNKLKLSKNCLAYDINLGCSGYPYGLMTAASLLDNFDNKRIILVVGDQSASYGAEDNGREILFGDACSATALEYDEHAAPIYFEGFSDGEGAKAIYIPEGGKRKPIDSESHKPKLREDGIIRTGTDVWLNGPEILSFSTRKVPEAINSILEKTDFEKKDIFRYYFHQANLIINKTINKKLGLTYSEAPLSLREYGNTSSTSIPITLCMDKSSFDDTQKNVLFCGFGVGLSWASVICSLKINQISSIKIMPKDYLA